MDDRIADRDRRPEQREVDHLAAVEGEDEAGDGEEDGGRIQIDRDLLDPRKSPLEEQEQRADRGHGEEHVADVRRRRQAVVPDGRLQIPRQLPDEPRGAAERDE